MSNKQIDITFIVPIYNAEKYISECLESILNQNVHKEILCINDGSTDSSLRILEFYAEKYPEIRIINKKNEGVSISRNLGISQALGRYIWFVDADDYLLVNDMADLITLADSCQVDLLRGLIVRENKDREACLIFGSSDEVNEQCLMNNKYAEIMPNTQYLLGSINKGFSPKIIAGFYRTSFLRQNQCYFPNSSVNNAEDEYFEMSVFSNSLTVKLVEISLPVYFYRYNDASSTKSRLKQFEGSLIVFPLILNLCQNIEQKIVGLTEKTDFYFKMQKLLWAVRFIALRLNFSACCDIYLTLSEKEQLMIKSLVKKENLDYLDEFKNMILAGDSSSHYAYWYTEFFNKIIETKNSFNM